MPTNKLPMAENPDYSFDGAWRGVSGRQHIAFTNRGRPIRAFVPGVGTAANDKYFCHGHTFDTFRLYGYSPFSGPWITRILEDEFTLVNFTSIRAGDVVAWSTAQGVLHSCLVINVGATPTVESVKVWSKNGRVAVDVFSLSQVNNAYPGMSRAYWRPV
jgi:hypothetical protein